MQIQALSRIEMIDLKERELDLLDKAKVISICCSEDINVFDIEHPNLLSLRFDDIEKFVPSHPHLVIFNEEMAEMTVQFLRKCQPKDLLLVNCHAGVSRSGAFISVAMEMFIEGIDAEHFFRVNYRIVPNVLVMRLLRQAAFGVTY